MSLAFTLPLAVSAAEAALFTVGCAAIHALRRQADRVTLALIGLLAILVLLFGIASTPAEYVATQVEGDIPETGSIRPGD